MQLLFRLPLLLLEMLLRRGAEAVLGVVGLVRDDAGDDVVSPVQEPPAPTPPPAGPPRPPPPARGPPPPAGAPRLHRPAAAQRRGGHGAAAQPRARGRRDGQR